MYNLSSLASMCNGLIGQADRGEEQCTEDKVCDESECNDTNNQENDDDDFDKCGPTHIESIDWGDENHRRIVAACLVQGVYIMETDSQKTREGPNALAPKWWEHFNFELVEDKIVRDKKNQSIVAAIFESKHGKLDEDPNNIPKYVIAFRGTILAYRTMFRDLKLNAQIALHRTGSSSRGSSARAVCEEFVEKAAAPGRGNPKIWLAGHSQGSTIALQVARHMAEKEKEEERCFIETYLFNPPYPSASAPIGLVLRNQEKLKSQFHFCKSALKAGLVGAAMGIEEAYKVIQRVEGGDDKLCLLWRPKLFVNWDDPICNGYEEHFGFSENMEGVYNTGAIEKLGSMHTTVNLISSQLGIQSDGAHLIQAAHLTFNVTGVNKDPETPDSFVAVCTRAYQAHQLKQWWNPEIELRSKTI